MSIELSRASQMELDRSIQRLADAAGSTVKEVLPAQMRLFAADLAFNTRPIGKDKSAQESGMQKVRAKIAAIYPSMGGMVWRTKTAGITGHFQRLMREKKYAEAEILLNSKLSSGRFKWRVGPFDNGELHRKQRHIKSPSEALVVTNYKMVERYLKKEEKQVGFAKGGYATGARQLGGVRGIPGFATRQKAPGSGRVISNGNSLSVELVNGVDYIDKALDRHGEARAIAHRERSVDAVIKRMMGRKTKAAIK